MLEVPTGGKHEGVKAALHPAAAPAPTPQEAAAIRHATGLEFKSNTPQYQHSDTAPLQVCPPLVLVSCIHSTNMSLLLECQLLWWQRPPLSSLHLAVPQSSITLLKRVHTH